MSSYHFVVPQQSSSTAAATPQSPRLTRHGSNAGSGQWFLDPTASTSSALNNFTYLRQHSHTRAQSPRTGTPTRTATPTRTFGSSTNGVAPRHSNSPGTPLRSAYNGASSRPSSPGASHRAPRASTPGGSSRAYQQQQTSGTSQQLRAHTPTRASAAKVSDIPLRERHTTPTRSSQAKQAAAQQDRHQGDNVVSPYLARLYERQLSQTRAMAPGAASNGTAPQQREYQGVVQQPPSLSPTLLGGQSQHQGSSGTSTPSSAAGLHSNKIRAPTPTKQAPTPRSVDSFHSVGGLTAASSSTAASSTSNLMQLRAPGTPPPTQQHRERERESARDNRPSLHPSSVNYPTPTKQQTGSGTPTPASTPTHQQSTAASFYDPFGTGPNSPTTPVMPRPQLNRREATPHTPSTRRGPGFEDSQSNISPPPSNNGSFAGAGDLTPLLYPSTPVSGTPSKASFAGAKQLFTEASASSQNGSTVTTPNTQAANNNSAVAAPTSSSSALSPSATSWTRGPKATLRAFVNCWVNKYKENSKSYKEGGYCTVNKGDRMGPNGRYTLLHKLGWGEFSVVWLARDVNPSKAHHTFVAVKIAKCHPSVINGTKYEINLLRYITDSPNCTGPMTELLDSFEHQGAYGLHMCMVMPVMGSNLLCVIDQMKARRRLRREKEIAMIKDLTMSSLKGLDALEMINVVHTDIKPENVLVAAPDPKMVNLVATCVGPEEEKLVHTFSEGDPNHPTAVLADFGLSFLLEHPSFMPPGAERVGIKKDLDIQYPGIANNRKGILIQTREYRAPEVLFGSTICCRSDIWSVGCMVYELITGDFLMDPKKKTSNEREMDIEHLAAMMHILGPVPQHISRSSQNPAKHLSRYFDSEGRFLHQDKLKALGPRRSIATELEVFLEPAEAERAAQFIMSCFTYDPLERCHARDLLNHSWLRSAVGTQ